MDFLFNPVQEQGYGAYRARVAAATASMRAKWLQLFQQRTRKRALAGVASGDLSEAHLAEALAGDDHVFRQRQKPGRFKVQISLLVDLSGSTSGQDRYKRAIEGAVLLMESLKDIPDIEFEIAGYKSGEPDIILKRFEQRLTPALGVEVVEKFEHGVGGGNGDDIALDKALKRIRGRAEGLKLIIMSSDGDPDNNIDRSKFAERIREADDVFTFGLGIGDEAKIVGTLFPEGRSVWAEDPSLTAEGIYRILRLAERRKTN